LNRKFETEQETLRRLIGAEKAAREFRFFYSTPHCMERSGHLLQVPIQFFTDVDRLKQYNRRFRKYWALEDLCIADPSSYVIFINVGHRWVHVHLYEYDLRVLTYKFNENVLSDDLQRLLGAQIFGFHKVLRFGRNDTCFYVEIPLVYDCRKLKCQYTEDIIKAAWHPRRVARWMEQGVDLDDL
jgi:hypothetical protein